LKEASVKPINAFAALISVGVTAVAIALIAQHNPVLDRLRLVPT